MKKYNAIIIDDEMRACEALKNLIEQYCPDINICGLANSGNEGWSLLESHKVEFLFLDISMPREDGFMFLRSLSSDHYGVIFVTAHQEYALRALKANAVDYLLKPVNPFELQEAVEKAISNYELRQGKAEERAIYHESLENLHTHIQSGIAPIARITVAEQSGFRLVTVADIMYLEADDNYTVISLGSNNKIIATRTLGEFEKVLDSPEFFRIHKSTIINMNYLIGFSNAQGNFAELKDGTQLVISRRKIVEFRERIKHFSFSID